MQAQVNTHHNINTGVYADVISQSILNSTNPVPAPQGGTKQSTEAKPSVKQQTTGIASSITGGQVNVVERISYTAFGDRRQGEWQVKKSYSRAGCQLFIKKLKRASIK